MGGSTDGLRQKQVDKVIGNVKVFYYNNWKKIILLCNYFESDITDQYTDQLDNYDEQISWIWLENVSYSLSYISYKFSLSLF